MNKFLNLKSNNEYVNLVLSNYVNCYDNLNEDSIDRFTHLFQSLKTHDISVNNMLVNKKPLTGVKLDLHDNKSMYRNTDELNEQLVQLAIALDQDNKKEVLFFKSVVCLCDSVNYLSTKEMFELNEMLNTIHTWNQDLNDPILENTTLFYSYNRYPKR